MQKIQPPYKCTVGEYFFLEKSIELLDTKTIDSHRVRIHNPLSILKELRHVVEELNKNRLKNVAYALSIIEEALFLIGSERELKFNSLSKKYYKNLLEKGGKGERATLDKIFYATNLVIADNKDYLKNLYDKLIAELVEINKMPSPSVVDFKKLNGIIGFFYAELIHVGFSKTYLYRFFRAIFFSKLHGQFAARVKILKSLLNRKEEKFKVIVGLVIPQDDIGKIKILNDKFVQLSRTERNNIVHKGRPRVSLFFEKYKEKCIFYCIELKALDYFSVVKIARDELQFMLDPIHMGHSDIKIDTIEECITVGENMPERADVVKLKYYLDGYYKSDQKLYAEFLNRISLLQEKKIDRTSISKIYSGLRYLRIGFEAGQLENKLLNYWIGLEYLFSPEEADEYTVGRIREYFRKCHAVIYFKRNLKYLHDSIAVLGLKEVIANYNQDLKYLANEATMDFLISKAMDFPLLAYRANSFKEQMQDIKKTRGTLEKHQKNLDWNINRIYRLRNQIVHNAATQLDIESISSHLRYYLVFILNGLMEFFINGPVDIDKDDALTIDDYLITQDILISNITSDDSFQKFDYLITLNNPVEYLS